MKKILALSALAGLALTACQPSGTIKIGFIGPLTGDAAGLGQDIMNGIRMAVDEVNAAGGAGGKQIALIAEDGKCASADANSAAQKLVNVDKVTALLGGQCSGETLAAAKVAEPFKIVLISAASSSPDVTNAGDHVFRIYPSDAFKTKAMAQYFRDKGYTKIAIVSENTDYATAFRDSLEKDVGSGALVFNETVDQGTKDFRSLYTRLEDIDFDVMVTNANQNAVMAEMMKQFREAGFEQPIVSQDVADTTDTAAAVGDAGREIYLINVPDVGSGTTFQASFVAKYGQPKSGISWAAYGYDSAKVMFQSLANMKEGQTLQQVLSSMPAYEGITGTIRFDANGDLAGASYALKKYQSGAIMTVGDIQLE